MLLDDVFGVKLLGQFVERCEQLRKDAEGIARDAGDFDIHQRWKALLASQCLD